MAPCRHDEIGRCVAPSACREDVPVPLRTRTTCHSAAQETKLAHDGREGEFPFSNAHSGKRYTARSIAGDKIRAVPGSVCAATVRYAVVYAVARWFLLNSAQGLPSSATCVSHRPRAPPS